MGMSWAEHSVEINAPVETSFDAIVDYESFPGWQDAVDSVEVLSRTADGLGENVRLFVDAKVRKINYQLKYSYDRPTEIRWDFVEGDGMRDVDGVYTLESLGPERSRATYKLGADPEIPVPGMVLRRTHKALVKRSVEDLKREAERRHAAGESSAPAGDASTAGEAGTDPRKRAPEPQPEPEGAGEWVPKAEREPEPGPEPSRGAGAGSGHSVSAIPAAVAGKGLSLAAKALRAGAGVAEGAIEAGKGAADRIDRILAGEQRDDERRRD